MAVRLVARLSSPLTQCLKYTVKPTLGIRPSKFTPPLLIDTRCCQTSRDNFHRSADESVELDQKNVTVVFPDGKSELMSMERAERIAEKRQSELVSVLDEADCRVVYRLVPLASSNSNHKSNAEKKEKPKKQPKGIDINTTTTERDLLVKCKKILKMVQNNHSVRIRLHDAEQMNKKTSTPEQEILSILQTTIQEFGTMREENRNDKRKLFLIEPKLKEDVQQD